MDLTSHIKSMQLALDCEIRAALRNQSKWFDLNLPQVLDTSNDGLLYSFKAEITTNIPAESPVIIRDNLGKRYKGEWIGQNDFDVLVAITEELPRGRFYQASIDLTYILKAAKALLDEKHSDVHSNYLFNCVTHKVDYSLRQFQDSVNALIANGFVANQSQMAALQACISQSSHFVWGPPGTGKTATLAQLCYLLSGQSDRTMILAHANAAVDVAALKIADCFKNSAELAEGKILRIGAGANAAVRGRPDLTVHGVLRRKFPAHLSEFEELNERRRNIVRNRQSGVNSSGLKSELSSIKSRLKELQEILAQAEKQLLIDAKVILATTAKFVLDERLHREAINNIILDEASMLTFPFVYLAARRPEKRLLFFGDFRQLPPVCLADETEAQKWLNVDPFEMFGIKTKVNGGSPDSRVTMLDIQYRMPEQVGNLVSALSYSNKLNTDPSASRRASKFALFAPKPRSPIVLVDTSDFESSCIKENRPDSFSRLNVNHGLIIISLIANLLSQGANRIAIITPYAAQARLLENLIRSFGFKVDILVSTVHRFQGAEKEFVIFDLVDAYPQQKASALTGHDPELASRLINVAISRTKGKLFIVLDKQFIEVQHSGRSPSRKLLQLLQEDGTISVSDFLRSCNTIDWTYGFASIFPKICQLARIMGCQDIRVPSDFPKANERMLISDPVLGKILGGQIVKPSQFFVSCHGQSMVVGGRSAESYFAIVSGDAKNVIERAIIGYRRSN